MSDGRGMATSSTASGLVPRAASSQLERPAGSNEPIKSRFTSASRDVTEQQWRAVDGGGEAGGVWHLRRAAFSTARFLCLGLLICVSAPRHGI